MARQINAQVPHSHRHFLPKRHTAPTLFGSGIGMRIARVTGCRTRKRGASGFAGRFIDDKHCLVLIGDRIQVWRRDTLKHYHQMRHNYGEIDRIDHELKRLDRQYKQAQKAARAVEKMVKEQTGLDLDA